MQETKIRTPAEDLPPSRPGWIRAVAILGVGALLIATLYGAWQAVANSDDPQDPAVPGNPDPDFSLTDEQAIATFERLEKDIRRSISDQDPGLALRATTTGSPLADRMQAEIRKLKKDRVFDDSRVEQVSVEVVASSSQEIRIREVVRIHPCFRSEDGTDITKGDSEFEQTGVWILQVEDGRWLIDETVFEGDRVIDSARATCAS